MERVGYIEDERGWIKMGWGWIEIGKGWVGNGKGWKENGNGSEKKLKGMDSNETETTRFLPTAAVFFSVFFVRYLTFFYYLNEPTLGGETAFPIADNKTVPVNEVCWILCHNYRIHKLYCYHYYYYCSYARLAVLFRFCFVCLFVFFSLYFHNALYSDNEINRVDVLGHRFVLCPFQSHVSPRLATWTKLTLSQAQNIFIP